MLKGKTDGDGDNKRKGWCRCIGRLCCCKCCKCCRCGQERCIRLGRLLFMTLLVACFVLGVFFFEDLKEDFLMTLTFIQHLGRFQGSIVLCTANIIGAILGLPCLPFTLASGFLYGTLFGTVLVSIASTVAAVIAFLISR
jgi:uncharacterized membrane protein YdjX (TVP38/TMEM64 family)